MRTSGMPLKGIIYQYVNIIYRYRYNSGSADMLLLGVDLRDVQD